MENKICLSQGLLNLIVMVQDYKRQLIDEKLFKESHGLDFDGDWYSSTKKYYNAINDEILSKYGLRRNRDSLEVILHFKVTVEMTSANVDSLGDFECWYRKI